MSILDDSILEDDDKVCEDLTNYAHIKPLVGNPRAEGHDHGVDIL